MNEPAPDKQQGVAGHVVDAVALGVETVGYELLAGATVATAAATAGMGAGHHVAGSAFDTAGATTVGSGFHQAGDALYAVARKSFALAGEAARSALDSFVGPPWTQVDGGVSHSLNPPGATTSGLVRSARRYTESPRSPLRACTSDQGPPSRRRGWCRSRPAKGAFAIRHFALDR